MRENERRELWNDLSCEVKTCYYEDNKAFISPSIIGRVME